MKPEVKEEVKVKQEIKEQVYCTDKGNISPQLAPVPQEAPVSVVQHTVALNVQQPAGPEAGFVLPDVNSQTWSPDHQQPGCRGQKPVRRGSEGRAWGPELEPGQLPDTPRKDTGAVSLAQGYADLS